MALLKSVMKRYWFRWSVIHSFIHDSVFFLIAKQKKPQKVQQEPKSLTSNLPEKIQVLFFHGLNQHFKSVLSEIDHSCSEINKND